jgi:polar amino acid transport system substrate-binding protein
VRAPTSPEVTNQFLAQNLDVAAGVKQQLEADARRVGGVRLLPGRFLVIELAMQASGFVADALKRHGVEGAAVAPRAALRDRG